MISIIVPAYQAEDSLADCIEALLAQTGLSRTPEIIVVDDGSTDETASIAERYPERVRLIRQPHVGAAAARNRGAAAAKGGFLLFTDADCRPLPDWAQRMAEPFDDPSVAGVKGRFLSDQRGLIPGFVQAEYEEKEARMLGQRQVAFADTAAAAYRSEVFRRVGGFREDLAAVEDTELAFRVAAGGQTDSADEARIIVVAPEAYVLHRHPEGLLAYGKRKLRYGIWGAEAYLAHPERLVEDSRTPQSMRLQLILGPLLALSLLALVGFPWLWPASLLTALGFGLSCLPFLRQARRAGWAILAIAPGMLWLRSLCLSCGLALGLVRRMLPRQAAATAEANLEQG